MSRRIGILGGTFNPPHLGHIHAANAVREALGLDEVWLMPTQLPPHKPMPAGSPDAGTRLTLVKLAVAGEAGLAACDLELTLPPPSYTAHTAKALRERCPEDTFWWIVGADMLLTMQNWYHPEEIFAGLRIAALARECQQSAAIAAHADYLRTAYGASIDLVEAEPYPMSSTLVREALQRGESLGMSPRVAAFIKDRGLYHDAV